MLRKTFLEILSAIGFTGFEHSNNIDSKKPDISKHEQDEAAKKGDRVYWVSMLDKMASPILSNMAKGELRRNMKIEYSSSWDNRDSNVVYLEAFGRLMGGIAPFLALEGATGAEAKIIERLKTQALQSLEHSVDANSPDYLGWSNLGVPQPLVDAAYLAQAFLYAPKALWEPLSPNTKQHFIKEFTSLRKIKPFNSNWLLFSAIIESFLLLIGEKPNEEKIDIAIDKFKEWYVGDGWYSDGPLFAMDHYNGYVIHPMLVDILRVNCQHGRRKQEEYELAYKRMQRYAYLQERFISPEGTFLVIGRSSTYRIGAFQPLVKLALENNLPDDLKPAQVRCALTAAMKRVFVKNTFTPDGWLTLGLVGDKQADIADYYTNTGSMYIASLVFLSLGLPAQHEFWSAPFAEWTQLKAWAGKPFDKDYKVEY